MSVNPPQPPASPPSLPPPGARLLIVDDDEAFRLRLARAMERRGWAVTTAESVEAAVAAATASTPQYAVVDLRLRAGSGLDVVATIRKQTPLARIVVLTGYGNIATAVAAMKAGAVDYLPKPADADVIEAALLARDRPLPPPPDHPMSADRVRWEHIQRVFEQCERNVSETARRLNMHVAAWIRPAPPSVSGIRRPVSCRG
ncbi:MAG: ActR/PrrA/RegA family redox response regulator transcription factor [Rhodospirillales bacterium]|nr:ActR/PrrA/RegA family redox response regulator transcription factor [Rhodospirillales bacterium]